MNNKIIGLMIVGILLVLAGCTSTQSPQAGTPQPSATGNEQAGAGQQPDVATVVIEGFAFGPSTIEIQKGDTIEWVNRDSAPHTVTFDNGMADENLPSSGTARVTFTEEGQFTYFCSFHPGMKGVVIVS